MNYNRQSAKTMMKKPYLLALSVLVVASISAVSAYTFNQTPEIDKELLETRFVYDKPQNIPSSGEEEEERYPVPSGSIGLDPPGYGEVERQCARMFNQIYADFLLHQQQFCDSCEPVLIKDFVKGYENFFNLCTENLEDWAYLSDYNDEAWNALKKK